MKKSIFYYSDKKLQFIEIKNFYSKFISLIVLFSSVFALVFFGGYIFITNIINPQSDVSKLRKENSILKEKYSALTSDINRIKEGLDELNKKDDVLRLSVNLDPLTEDEKNVGIGGSEFKDYESASVSKLDDIVNNVDLSIDLLKSKYLFIKKNYDEIESSLTDNVELQKAIPALLPSDGPIGDRFGMRLHPILKIRRMHPGIDIVVNTGTEVFAPGDGKIIRVGRRGGYGLTIEIDHGFGYSTLYAHLSKVKVKKGTKVKRGDLIALSGKSGSLATGPHLHYEVRHNGVLLNPRNFIFSDIRAFDLLTTQVAN